MVSISYTTRSDGVLIAKWPGKSVRRNGKVVKEGQFNLGKVCDREHHIFWSRERGYYTFDPETQQFGEPSSDFIPEAYKQADRRTRRAPVIVDFGDAFFLDQFIRGIGYDRVLESIPVQNRDSLNAMLAYYALEHEANMHAEGWCKQSYTSFLYPKANLASQRISYLLSSIGRPENIRNFLIEHIKYIINSTNDDLCIIIDSTGMENKCDLDITNISNHNNDVKLEFRMIAVIQKSTGLPLYYECIAGNIIDITTIERTIEILGEYNCKVEYILGDAAYCCPSVMEKLIFRGIDFITRLSPNYKLYKEAYKNHYKELDDKSNVIKFNNRYVSIVKVKTVVAFEKNTNNEIYGYIYLCKDLFRCNIKINAFLSSKMIQSTAPEEFMNIKDSFGVFAIVTTVEVPNEKILEEYYIRQSIEQYFDFGKQYAKYLPVRQHNIETLRGHLLISFIVTFLIVLIKNRLSTVALNYISIPKKLIKNVIKSNNYFIDESRCIIKQNILLDNIVNESPSNLFRVLRWQKADIFDTKILPTIADKKANDFYQAFGLSSPYKINRTGNEIDVVYKNKPDGLTKELAFSIKKDCIDEDTSKNSKQNSDDCTIKNDVKKNSNNKYKGRVPGTKNRKTIQREKLVSILKNIFYKKGGTEEIYKNTTIAKRKRGKPKGRPNKKTVERRRFISLIKNLYISKGGDAQDLSIIKKKKRGPKKGSYNKKTIAKVALLLYVCQKHNIKIEIKT